MEGLLKDIRFTIRGLLKRPGFTAIATITLALGIGASTAIFTVVDAALIRGLPYRSPERLYHLWEITPQKEFAQREFSYPDYQDYQQNRVCDGIAAYTGGGAIMSGFGEPELVFAPAASANFFSVLGVEPVLGRTFAPGEDKPGANRVAVITYGMWQRRFGGDKSIVGQALTLNGDSYTVIGVLPQTFQFALRPADLFRVYQPTDAQLSRRFLHGTNLIARLKPGVTVEQAQTELGLITSRIEQEYKESHAGTRLRIIPLQEQVTGQVKPILMALLAAVGFVLLIACANVAGLLLTKSLSRRREVAIRAALGASRAKVVRQLLTESLILSLAGGAAGLLIARWGLVALVAVMPDSQINALPFLKSLQIDPRILGFSFLLSLLTGIVFGLAPALESSRLDLNEALKETGWSSSSGSGQRLRSAFVMTQIALAVMLLVGAGLMLKSLRRLLNTNVGFNSENVLTMTVTIPATKYNQPSQQVQFFQELKERVESLPGVTAVGTVDRLPLQSGNTTRFHIEGDPVPVAGQETEANIRVVNETYFRTLGVPAVAGRMFDERDKADAPGVVIIGKNVADKLFAGRDPIGRRIVYGSSQSTPDTIVGVVGDIKITGLDDTLRPVLYYPYQQATSPAANLVVRTNVDPLSLAATIRNDIRSLDPGVALFNVNTVAQLISNSPAAFTRRLPGLLISIFAALALLLSAIGIYGVVSYSVSQQTHYIGVRMALGATPFDILKLILKQGLLLSVVGMAVGAIGALALMRFLSSLLFEVQTSDAATYAVVIGTLFMVTLLACYVPAKRATKVDPLVALRYE